MSDQIKVLVVDDSTLVRKIVTDILESDPLIKVVGTANNGRTAIFRNNQLNPDVITMDIEMPILDGLAALKEIIKENPKPVIMMSVLTQHGAEATFKALELGAVDFIPKPSSILSLSVDEIAKLLISKIKSVHKSKIRISKERFKTNKEKDSDKKEENFAIEKIILDKGSTSDKIICIGTSTGGPSALFKVFREFPEKFPSPVLIVQHMPPGFTKMFSERLDHHSSLSVKEAENGESIHPGHAYVAPGDSHMEIYEEKGKRRIKIHKGKKVCGHRPSIDVLFNSFADIVKKDTIAVIMTGMGRDGADGIYNIKQQGGYTIAQDENTSVVYGMNKVAVQKGGIDVIIPLYEITKKIVEHI